MDTSSVDSHLEHGDYVGYCYDEPPRPPGSHRVNALVGKRNHLIEVFPNPAKELITIRYQLIKDSQIIMGITDINGNRLHNLSSPHEIGHHEIQIDVSDMPAGIYFLHLSSEDQVITRKLAIMK